jgi:hypothetical protein
VSARLSELARDGYRVHLACTQPRCPYGGRTVMAADLLTQHGDITIEQLKARAACGEWRRRRDEGVSERRHRVMVEVSSPGQPGAGGFTDRDRR